MFQLAHLQLVFHWMAVFQHGLLRCHLHCKLETVEQMNTIRREKTLEIHL